MTPKIHTIDYSALRVCDLTKLASRRIRVRGTFGWVPDKQRTKFISPEFLLVREPHNRHDAKAIAIYSRQRKIGYVSAATAASLAAILDTIDGFDGYVVSGAAEESSTTMVRFFVDLPSIPALRELAKQLA